MTLFLASVRNAAEAEAALEAGADIVDLKEPEAGALGAVDRATSAAILSALRGRVAVSATIGDLPMRPAIIRDAVGDRASLGVDHVKVGLFPEGDPLGCLEELGAATRDVSLIVVVFADRLPGFEAVDAVAAAGAAGIMLDTAEKGAGSLLDHLGLGEVSSFIFKAKLHGLSVGLAGSLRAAQIPALLALEPDVLGFRGALCRGARNASLDLASCLGIRKLIPRADRRLARRPFIAFNRRAAEALC
jgi:uncharacterized protein (UPF0264 family)